VGEPVTLPVPGSARFGAWLITADLLPGPVAGGRTGSDDRPEVWCDPAVVGSVLQVRSRRPGDRLRPLGLDGTKKLQDLFVDRKVPRGERDAVPIVCGERGIIWVVDLAVAADAVASGVAGAALRLAARRERRNGPESA
jgi:tRNA(Ile)-lysidine synthase